MGLVGLLLFASLADAGEDAPEAGGTSDPSQLLQQAERRVGDKSPELLPLLARAAEQRFHDGDLPSAGRLRHRALDITIAAQGSDSVDATVAMTNLAEIDIARLRYLRAEPLLIAAREALSEKPASTAPALSLVLADLARVALARGRNPEAEKLADEAIAAAPATAAIDSEASDSKAMRVKGAALTAEHRYDEARRVLDRVLAQDRARCGEDRLPTARSLSQLGNLDLREQRYVEALPLLEQAASIDRNRLAPSHPFIADDLYDLGMAYDGLKRTGDALRAFNAALKLLENSDNAIRIAYVELELARLYRATGQTAAGDAAFAEARRILRAAETAERERERQA